MLTNEMQMRAELLGRVLATGIEPLTALDHARKLWDFIDYGNNEIVCGVDFASEHASIVGLMISGDGTAHRFDGDGRDLEIATLDWHPVYAGIRTVHQDGHAMVEIPAFYVRVDHDGGLLTWAISDRQHTGFTLHPAFRRPDGSAAKAIRIGAYAAGQRDGKVVVEAGCKPWTVIDFDDAEARVGELGRGWRMWSIYDLSAVQILAMIELGGTDMQKLVGRGNVDGGGPVGGGEGRASWRGLHELWGNVWQMVDGLRIAADGVICVWSVDRPGSGEWIRTGVEYGPGSDDGFPVSFHDERGDGFDLSLLFLPNEVSGDAEEAVIADWVWGHWGSRETVAYCGGSWSLGVNAGVFALRLGYARSDTGTYIGFRPAFAI